VLKNNFSISRSRLVQSLRIYQMHWLTAMTRNRNCKHRISKAQLES